jgi:hypothetical protein
LRVLGKGLEHLNLPKPTEDRNSLETVWKPLVYQVVLSLVRGELSPNRVFHFVGVPVFIRVENTVRKPAGQEKLVRKNILASLKILANFFGDN